MIRGVLAGKGGDQDAPAGVERSARTVTVINAAAALFVSGLAPGYQEAAAMAEESIDSGAAAAKLDALVALSQKLK